MAIDIRRELLLKLSQAAQSLQHPVAPSSIWRWTRRGIRNIRLESVVIGGIRYTSAEALERFAAAVTAASEPMIAVPTFDAVPPTRDESTTRRLKEAGLLQ